MSENANAPARALVARIASRNGDALREGLASWIAIDKMCRDVAAARRVARGAEALFDRELDELVRSAPGLTEYTDWNGVVAARNALPALLPLSLAVFIRYAEGSWTRAAIAFVAAALVHLAVVGWLSWRTSE